MQEQTLEKLIQMAREANRQIEYTIERVVVRALPRTGADAAGDPYETVGVSKPITRGGGTRLQAADEPQEEQDSGSGTDTADKSDNPYETVGLSKPVTLTDEPQQAREGTTPLPA
jgi:hypothetical protein